MQTDANEELTMQSSVYDGKVQLLAGDIISLEYETKNSHDIYLKLYSSGQYVKQFTIAPSNTQHERKVISIPVDEQCVFDQLRISGEFEPKDRIAVYDISVEKGDLYDESSEFRSYKHDMIIDPLYPSQYDYGHDDWPHINFGTSINDPSVYFTKINSIGRYDQCKQENLRNEYRSIFFLTVVLILEKKYEGSRVPNR